MRKSLVAAAIMAGLMAVTAQAGNTNKPASDQEVTSLKRKVEKMDRVLKNLCAELQDAGYGRIRETEAESPEAQAARTAEVAKLESMTLEELENLYLELEDTKTSLEETRRTSPRVRLRKPEEGQDRREALREYYMAKIARQNASIEWKRTTQRLSLVRAAYENKLKALGGLELPSGPPAS